jgi:hypothetical protein
MLMVLKLNDGASKTRAVGGRRGSNAKQRRHKPSFTP